MYRIELPLLHDNHNHTSLYAALESCPDISRMDRAEALLFLRSLPEDGLSLLRGWRSNAFALDPKTLALLPPLLLINISLHGYLVSDAGLPLVAAAAPDLAAHRDDPAWAEANVPRLFEAYCGLAGLDAAKLGAFMDSLAAAGFGSAEDLTVSSAQAFRLLARSPRTERAWAGGALWGSFRASLDEEEGRSCAGMKLFLDGALGSRSAAVEASWIGGGGALYTYSDDALEAAISRACEGSRAPALSLHAIGEGAIGQALRVLERALRNGLSFPLVRIEHAQFVTESQARRIRELGFVLSMQPNFTSDTVTYADRLPAAVLARNNPFRMLIDEVGFVPGKDLLFGSDGMPQGIEYAAACALFPPLPGQRLSLEELAAGYGPARGIEGGILLEVDEDRRLARLVSAEVPTKRGRTLYAPAEREPPEAIAEASRLVSGIGPLRFVLDSLPEVALVLGGTRQVIYANAATLAAFGMGMEEVLGERTGELLGCIHAWEEEGGCGSSESCRFCGAVNAILEAGRTGARASRECRITVEREGRREALDLLVTASGPARGAAGGELPYTVVTMHDISDAKRRAVLERIFFHDVLNSITSIQSGARLLKEDYGSAGGGYVDHILASTECLLEEVLRQRDFLAMERGDLAVQRMPLSGRLLLSEVIDSFRGSELARDKRLVLEESADASLETDPVLLRRVLVNMVKNALEASSPGEAVLASAKADGDRLLFCVHNPAAMPEEVQRQVFQRSFSTKGGGRGMGTYGMRMIVEGYLGGEISFLSDPDSGTTFTASLPGARRR